MWWPRSATCSRRPKPQKRSSTDSFTVRARALLPVRLMRVAGHSMAPTLQAGALIAVDLRAFLRRAPRRGELVAMRPAAAGGRTLVKRLIGLPHERVQL